MASARLAMAVALAVLALPGRAQAEDSPPIAITHALVYVPGTHAPIPDATVVIAGGKVQAVGASVAVPPDAQVLDAHGKIVTPGFIDADTDVGVIEIDLEPGSNDTGVARPSGARATYGRRVQPPLGAGPDRACRRRHVRGRRAAGGRARRAERLRGPRRRHASRGGRAPDARAVRARRRGRGARGRVARRALDDPAAGARRRAFLRRAQGAIRRQRGPAARSPARRSRSASAGAARGGAARRDGRSGRATSRRHCGSPTSSGSSSSSPARARPG